MRPPARARLEIGRVVRLCRSWSGERQGTTRKEQKSRCESGHRFLLRHSIPWASRSILIAEPVVDVAQEAGVGCDALSGPFGVEIGNRIGREHFRFALALV